MSPPVESLFMLVLFMPLSSALVPEVSEVLSELPAFLLLSPHELSVRAAPSSRAERKIVGLFITAKDWMSVVEDSLLYGLRQPTKAELTRILPAINTESIGGTSPCIYLAWAQTPSF
jgi:hypothetical protein